MSTAALHDDIQAHRAELAEAVDLLAAKLDVRPKITRALHRAALPAAGLLAALVAFQAWRRHR
jgi:hypothetical protein